MRRRLSTVTLVALAALPVVAVAGPFDDTLVQPPTLGTPERASLAGSLAELAIGPADMSRGAFTLPAPITTPSERGALLAPVIPTYSADAGLSEWGQGWATGLEIRRFRTLGEVDYASDDFSSPWGQLVRGTDGAYYPRGLSQVVRATLDTNGAWTVVDAHGTRHLFRAADAVVTPRGTYAWVLGAVSTIEGEHTELEWIENASGRPFLSHVRWGGRGADRQYDLELVYQTLGTPLDDYRAGVRQTLDRRVVELRQHVRRADTGAWTRRHVWFLRYTPSPSGPAFYLTEIQRQFSASGALEPPHRYSYDLDGMFGGGTLLPLPELDPFLAAWGTTALGPAEVSFIDVDQDGVSEFEHAASMTTWQLADGTWQSTELPPMSGAEDPLCRRAPGNANIPRQILPLAAGDAPLRVVSSRFSGGQTIFASCDVDGTLLADSSLTGAWELSPTTRLADVDRDLRPDLVRLNTGSVDVWRNGGTADALAFEALPRQALTPRFTAESAWIQDMNGDGVADLVGRGANVLAVWFGRGNMTFETDARRFAVFGLDGRRITQLGVYDITWVDANRDGLVDMLTTYGGNVRLYTSDGYRFDARDLPALQSLGLDSGLPIAVDLSGRGESEIVMVRQQHAHALAFTQASNGLLVGADDGKGTAVTFAWTRSAPLPGMGHRPAVLEGITRTSIGETPVSWLYDYERPALHSVGRFLLGFRGTRRVAALSSEAVELHHDDDVQGLVLSETVVDTRNAALYRFIERSYEERLYQGVRWRRPAGDRSGWRRLDGTAEVGSSNRTLAYDREFCPTVTESVSRAGTLRRETVLADVALLADVPHCLSRRQRIRGTHAIATRNFDYSAETDRDAFGAVTAVRSLGGAPLLLQQVTYDAEHRVASITRPGQGTTLTTWEPGTGRLLRQQAPDGVASTMVALDPVTDAPLDVRQARGAATWTASYRFDAEERLWQSWDDLASGGATEEVGYRYAAGGLPGVISVRTRRAPGVIRDTLSLQSATGRALVEMVRQPGGWSFGQLAHRDGDAGLDVALDRDPLPAGVDPRTLGVAALFAGAVELGRTELSGFGDTIASTSTVQAGVLRHLTNERRIRDGEIVLSQHENGAYLTESGLDDAGRVWWRKDEAGEVTRFDRDAMGRLVAVILPDGKRHTLTFDGHGRQAVIARDGVGRVSYAYDPVTGLVASRTLTDTANQVERIVRTTRDAIGRPILERHEQPRRQGVREIRHEWDQGLLSRVTGPGFEKRMTYRVDGRLVSQSTTITGFRRVDETFGILDDDGEAWHEYRVLDAAGTELSKVRQENVYDATGRLAALRVDGVDVARFVYDARGHLDRADLAGGGTRTWRRDPVTHRARGFEQATPAWRGSVEWTLDTRGLVVAEAIGFGDSTLRRQFAHDERRFLTAATGDAGTATYAYDEIGLLASAAEAATTFDAGGRAIRRGDLELVYGPSGQVEEARRGTHRWSYVYDEAGRRLARIDGGAVREAWVAGGHLDADSLSLPLSMDGHIVGLLDGGAFVPVFADARGTLLTEGAAPIIPTPYGVRASHPARAAALDYAAQGYDVDLGTVRMGARDFDPALGRFLTPDPMMLENLDACAGAAVECNLYSYGRNDPLLYWDPQGHEGKLSPAGGPATLSANQYEIVTRSFAPFARFGGPGWGTLSYEGDNRGFSPAIYDTARITQATVIDPSAGKIVSTRVYSDRTEGFGLVARAMAVTALKNPLAWNLQAFAGSNGRAQVWAGKGPLRTMQLSTSYEGAMPLAASPDIDVETGFRVTQAGDRLHVSGAMYGDAFPNAEVFIHDAAGNSLFLHSFATSKGIYGPYYMLFGEGKSDMGQFGVDIILDDKGNFSGVDTGDATYTVEQWNGLFTGKGKPAED